MKKYLFFVCLSFISLLTIFVYQYVYFYDNKLHVVFCSVGQGDAIFIKTPTNKHILIDGGPDNSVLSCLSEQMPFWERRLDLMILTHPHADHFIGLVDVIDRFITLSFATERLGNKTQSFKGLGTIITEKKISQRIIFEGDRYKLGDDIFLTVEAPSQELLRRASPNGMIGESGELASLILKLTYKDFDILLTGDAQAEALSEAVSHDYDSIEVLQAPHHGSKTGLNEAIIERIAPQMAVISVGDKNSYGHPNQDVLQILAERGIKILRTDRKGDIEIVSDGKRWWVK
ncbi:MBL fold metallo-hydrolase [Patescibacteria group bacterium]|nr:MBL fold metallo-hydrolase [Patescibacteria group bacterium]